jgi:hypothetical protein
MLPFSGDISLEYCFGGTACAEDVDTAAPVVFTIALVCLAVI